MTGDIEQQTRKEKLTEILENEDYTISEFIIEKTKKKLDPR